MSRKISQREARAALKRVAKLERIEQDRRQAWSRGTYPGGIHIYKDQIDRSGWVYGALKTARRLGCALVGTFDDDGVLHLYAVKW